RVTVLDVEALVLGADRPGSELELRAQAIGELRVIGAEVGRIDVEVELGHAGLRIDIEDGQRQWQIEQTVGSQRLVLQVGPVAAGRAEINVVVFGAQHRGKARATEDLPGHVLLVEVRDLDVIDVRIALADAGPEVQVYARDLRLRGSRGKAKRARTDECRDQMAGARGAAFVRFVHHRFLLQRLNRRPCYDARTKRPARGGPFRNFM